MNKGLAEKYGKMAEKALKEAVKEAYKKHAKLGIPAVFMKDGKILYRLPNGSIVSKLTNPSQRSKKPKK
jgi:hypothetical protein